MALAWSGPRRGREITAIKRPSVDTMTCKFRHPHLFWKPLLRRSSRMSAAPISRTLPTTPGLDIPGAFPSTPFQLVESNPLMHRENATANAAEAGATTAQVQAASTAPAAAAVKPEAPVQEKLVTTPNAVPREHKVDANGRRIRSSYFPYRQYPPSPPTPVPAPDSNARANGKIRTAPPATGDADGTAPVRKQSLLRRIRTRLGGGRKAKV
ncbi:hypothetical protein B0H19DRAFT_1139854 [Mycena capillaripes]|nr:hypothetical protein B0H19DRAFT_1139854 [Mycena capillaripes]